MLEKYMIIAKNGHVVVEKYIAEQFGSWASFRPQYMIGSSNNKDCEEWFFDSNNNNQQPVTPFNPVVFSSLPAAVHDRLQQQQGLRGVVLRQ
jgi:hypothetical protein